jgi:hypothetical protein
MLLLDRHLSKRSYCWDSRDCPYLVRQSRTKELEDGDAVQRSTPSTAAYIHRQGIGRCDAL